jgi:hypothetical protein
MGMKIAPFYSKNGYFRSQRGLTLIELMIGTVLLLAVSAGVFRFVREFSTKTSSAQEELSVQKRVIGFKRLLSEEVENIVPMQNSRASFLSVSRPFACVNTSDANEIQEMSWSLIPFPGYNLDEYTSTAAFGDLFTNPVDPTIYFDNASDAEAVDLSDGVIFATVDREASLIQVARNAAGSLFPTAQIDPSDGSFVDQPIVLETRDGLEVGDYIFISDSFKRDLVRITSLVERADGFGFDVFHNNASIWNIPFEYDFGYTRDNSGNQIEIPGGAYVVKANISSYFFDPDTNTIQKDNHVLDDGFNPDTLAYGASGLVYAFQPILSNVQQFKIGYRVVDPLDNVADGVDDTIVTRTPRPGIYGRDYARCIVTSEAFCDCQNQLGFSDMKKLELDITMLPDPSDPGAAGQKLATNLSFVPKKLVDPPSGSSTSLLLNKPELPGVYVENTKPASELDSNGGSSGSDGPIGGGSGGN